jgi:hypothetical protein
VAEKVDETNRKPGLTLTRVEIRRIQGAQGSRIQVKLEEIADNIVDVEKMLKKMMKCMETNT